MAYSKETERQNKVLGDLLAGREPEKRIMVGYEGKKQESGDKKSHLTDIMAEARMPMFCPECDKVMKKKLDNKIWRLFEFRILRFGDIVTFNDLFSLSWWVKFLFSYFKLILSWKNTYV